MGNSLAGRRALRTVSRSEPGVKLLEAKVVSEATQPPAIWAPLGQRWLISAFQVHGVGPGLCWLLFSLAGPQANLQGPGARTGLGTQAHCPEGQLRGLYGGSLPHSQDTGHSLKQICL